MPPVPLADWANFYVIVGSAAAGLTGLTFVVISLAAERRINTIGLRTFVTPIVVHFGAVLGLSLYLSIPNQTVTSLSVGCAVAGAAGLAYVGFIAASMRRVTALYVPVHEDWIWNIVVPAFAYAASLAMALLCWHQMAQSLYGIAAVSVLLLLVGIHNAWDVAVWNSVQKPSDSPQ